MSKRLTHLMLLLAGAASLASASALVLQPADGNVTGSPGQTVGWGFQMTADSADWISVTGSLLLFESDPAVGLYTDWIGPQGGPTNFVLAPNSPDWIQAFDADLGTGVGSFTIDPGAANGESDSATLRVLYDEFSADPNTCAGCYVGSAFVDNAITVTAAPTPEPAVGELIGLGLLGLLLSSRRKLRRSS